MPQALTGERTVRTLLNLLLAEALEVVRTSLTSCTLTAFSRFSCTKEVTDLTSSHHFLHLPVKLLLQVSHQIFQFDKIRDLHLTQLKVRKVLPVTAH